MRSLRVTMLSPYFALTGTTRSGTTFNWARKSRYSVSMPSNTS